MQATLLRAITHIENAPFTLKGWLTTFFSIILVRFLIEKLLNRFTDLSPEGVLLTLIHYFLEFFLVAIAFILIARFAGEKNIRKAAQFTLFGFLLIWTPPITDFLILNNPSPFSLYEFGSWSELVRYFFTFFDDTPEIGITYGIRVEIFIAIVFMTIYSFLKKKSLIRATSTGILTYLMLYIVSTLPSWLTLILLGPSQGFFEVTAHDAIALFLSPTPLFGYSVALIDAGHLKMSLVYGALIVPIISIFVFIFFRGVFWSLFHNLRFPQLIYHAGLFCIGVGLTFFYHNSSFHLDLFHLLATFVLLAAVECAWLASVVVNDFRDLAIDRLTNTHRPLVTGAIDVPTYKTIGALFFAASLFLSAIVSTQATLILVLYQAFAFLYSADPLRLKRYPIVATAIAALASLLVLFFGFTVFSSDKSITALPISITALLFFAYLAIIPIKDFKDIVGDQADGVFTLPVLLGEDRAKRLIGAFIFIVFVASPFALSLRSLFPLGLFFGAIGYWILQLSAADHRYLSYRKLPAWFVVLAAGYGAFLAFALAK